MNFLGRPLMRNIALRTNLMGMRNLGKPALPLRFTLARPVASSVSGKPGSQSLEHAATNIKEEVGNSAADLAKVIAACNVNQDSVGPTRTESFVRRASCQRVEFKITAVIVAWYNATGSVRRADAYDGFRTRRCVIFFLQGLSKTIRID